MDGVYRIPLPGRLTTEEDHPSDENRSLQPLRDFVVDAENNLAPVVVEAVLAGRVRFNPLALVGPPGAGKTHLCWGLACAFQRQHRDALVTYLSATDLIQQGVSNEHAQVLDELRRRRREADLLVVEDIHRLHTRAHAQGELLACLDAVLAREGQLVVTSQSAVNLPQGFSPRLRSRLVAGLTVQLNPPGLAARMALLEDLAEELNIEIQPGVLQLLATEVEPGVPSLRGTLLWLAAEQRRRGQTLDTAATRALLSDKTPTSEVPIRTLALGAARYFGLKLADLKSPSRSRSVVTGRAVAMYLARCYTSKSLDQIGRYFGGRDHTTVLHNCRRTEQRLKSDPETQQTIADLQTRLKLT